MVADGHREAESAISLTSHVMDSLLEVVDTAVCFVGHPTSQETQLDKFAIKSRATIREVRLFRNIVLLSMFSFKLYGTVLLSSCQLSG
jgi:hypothetical protein